MIIGEPVTLSFWHSLAPDSAGDGLLAELIQEFEAQYPEITIEAEYQGDDTDLYKKLLAAILAGEPPAVAVSHPFMIADYIRAGALVALGEYMNDPVIGLSRDDREDFYPGCLADGRYAQYGNEYYSFPFSKSALGMWYNMDVIRAAGYEAPPRTWAEFERMALDVHAQTGACAYAYDLSASTFEGWLRSRGANLLSDDATVAVFNGREGVDALEMMVRLIDVGAACRSEGPDGVMEEFAKGNVAFVMGSTAEGGAYRQAVARAGIIDGWGQTIIPQSNPDHPRTVLHGGNIFVLKGDDLGQKAAWLLVRFLADTEQTARGDVASGAVPVRRSASALLEDQLANDPIAREQLERIVPYAYPEANARGTQEMRVHIREAMVAALEGSMTPQEALDQAALRSDQALALGRQ